MTYPTLQIFVGWDCIEAFLWYLFAIETVGKTLEELEEVFSSPYPPRTKARKVVAIKDDGHVDLIRNA